MSKTVQIGTGSFPLMSVLTVIFVVAKLMGKISWSWWWVFTPIWIIPAGLLLLFLAGLLFTLLAAALE